MTIRWPLAIGAFGAALCSAALWHAGALRAAPPALPATVHCMPSVAMRPLRMQRSPEMEQRMRASMRRMVMHLQMSLATSVDPYTFILSASERGMGADAPVPQIERNSIRFTFRRAGGGDAGAHVHLLPYLPEPATPPNPCDTVGYFAAGVFIDVHGLQPGMYELGATANVGPMLLPSDNVPVTGATATLQDWRMYIPPQPLVPPQRRVGQRVLVFPDDKSVYHDVNGDEIPRRWIAMHEARIVAIDGGRITYAIDGFQSSAVVYDSGPITQVSGFVPIVDDQALRDLNRRYDGRQIWGRGGLGAQCVLDTPGGTFGGGGPTTRAYAVKRVFRIYRSSYDLAIGGQVGAISGGRQSEFLDESPLLVWLDVPSDVRFSAIMGTGSIGVRARTPGPQATMHGAGPKMGPSDDCVAYFAYFADAWDMNRAYSLTPPPAPHFETVHTGMTHEQVAWTLGYPAMLGTPEELDRLQAWRYDNLPPFSYWVYFNADGRVTKFGPDGELP